MPNLLVLAVVLVMFWFLRNYPKLRFVTGMFFGVLCIAFYEIIEPLGGVIAYGAIAIVIWFYSTIGEEDKDKKAN